MALFILGLLYSFGDYSTHSEIALLIQGLGDYSTHSEIALLIQGLLYSFRDYSAHSRISLFTQGLLFNSRVLRSTSFYTHPIYVHVH